MGHRKIDPVLWLIAFRGWPKDATDNLRFAVSAGVSSVGKTVIPDSTSTFVGALLDGTQKLN